MVMQVCFESVLNETEMVLEGGLEPPHLTAQAPQACVSTNSTIRARFHYHFLLGSFCVKNFSGKN